MGETRVDLLHLLEDLRDAHPASLEETILTEVIATRAQDFVNTFLARCGEPGSDRGMGRR